MYEATEQIPPPSLAELLRSLLSELLPHRRWQLAAVFGLMLVGAVSELATLGALMPLLAAMADPEGSPIMLQVRPVLAGLGAESPQHGLYLLAGFFAVAALLAALLRLVLLLAVHRLVYGIAYDLSTRLYSDTLSQPYVYHTRHNSSEVIASINKVEFVTSGILLPMMNGTVALVISVFIVAGLVVIDPVVAVLAGCGFVAIYLLATVLTRSRLRSNGAIIASAQGSRVRAMQEGLGGNLVLDLKNPDPTLQDRRLCGLTSITGLRPVGNNLCTAADFTILMTATRKTCRRNFLGPEQDTRTRTTRYF